MPKCMNTMSRRELLAVGAAAGASLASAGALTGEQPKKNASANRDKALIAITLDLEMARNFPTWDQTHWDYEKGNLNDDAKKYSVEAARRVKANSVPWPRLSVRITYRCNHSGKPITMRLFVRFADRGTI